MKITKILLAFASCIAFSCTATADEGSLSNIQFGYSSNDADSPYIVKENRGGFYLGWDIMATSKYGIGYGIGLDGNMWTADDTTGVHTTGWSMYTAGATAKLGYTFENQFDIPLKLKGGYGYGVIYQDSHNSSGAQYEGSIEYTVFEEVGVGVKYKHSEGKILGQNLENSSTIGYVYFEIWK